MFQPGDPFPNAIASQFVVSYFQKRLNKASLLQDYYSEHSTLSFAKLHQEQVTYIGADAIVQCLEQFADSLGKFKLDVSTVDTVHAGNSIVICCTGSIFTATQEDTFTHSFLLAPTPRRQNCYYILAETVRILSSEKDPEPVPPPAAAAPSSLHDRWNQPPAAKPAAGKRAEPPAESLLSRLEPGAKTAAVKPVTPPVKPATPQAKPAAAPAPAPAPAAAAAAAAEEKPKRERLPKGACFVCKEVGHRASECPKKPAEEPAAAAAPAPAPAPPADDGKKKGRKERERFCLGLLSLDRTTTMDEVWYACAEFGKVVEVRWWGAANAAVEMKYRSDAEKMKDPATQLLIKKRKVKVEPLSVDEFDALPPPPKN